MCERASETERERERGRESEFQVLVHDFTLSPSYCRDRFRNGRQLDGKMSYKDFIWFLLSEEDKTSLRRYLVLRILCMCVCG